MRSHADAFVEARFFWRLIAGGLEAWVRLDQLSSWRLMAGGLAAWGSDEINPALWQIGRRSHADPFGGHGVGRTCVPRFDEFNRWGAASMLMTSRTRGAVCDFWGFGESIPTHVATARLANLVRGAEA